MNHVNRPRRVLLLVENNSYPKDPRVRKEALTLTRAGYSVAVIAPNAGHEQSHDLIDGVDVYRYQPPRAGDGLLTYAWEYLYSMAAMFFLSLWIFVRHGFDVIHAANPPDTLVFVAAPFKLFGVSFIFDHHDLAPEMYYARFPDGGNRWVYRVLVLCEKLSCRMADRVIATNESYKSVEVTRDGVPPNLISIVRNGPELRSRDHDVENDVDKELREQAGTIVAYSGIIGVQDGVDYLLRAIRHLTVTFNRTDVLCLIIGDGDELPRLRHLAHQLNISDYVRFTGWISDPRLYARYLSTADICVDSGPSNPYNDRCTAIKMMEYMALRKPIVAFDLPEHRFTAQSGAVYVRPNDEQEFARAIADLMDDPRRRQRLGALNRQRVEDELSWSRSARILLEMYDNVLPLQSAQHIPASAPVPAQVRNSYKSQKYGGLR